jgi:hypothetical protein
MKLGILVILLLLTACTAPAQEQIRAMEQAAPNVPAVNNPDTRFTSQCEESVDPQVMLDAFPESFESYVQVGETIAERSELPTPDGMTLQSSALRTLTINDDVYIAFSGADSCGFNTNLAQMQIMTPFDNEDGWVRRVTVDGRQAWMDHDTRSGMSNVYVLLKERALIVTNGDNEDDVLQAAGAVDYDSIEAAME